MKSAAFRAFCPRKVVGFSSWINHYIQNEILVVLDSAYLLNIDIYQASVLSGMDSTFY